ncbi:MAG: uL13 family ribosomal protein, partial [Microgenomates group bacterium]
MKTYQPGSHDVKRVWHLVDAKDKVLGRVASDVAELLMGKGKTDFSRHMDSGDFVVVT